ncbi:putative chaperone [Trypanosoma rangeli]|uniref:Putative chaperone n=1 Tax=Trypanosoma rangeli TaxID=5698 RepID=A0A3R7M7W7_TRYRA|nr:putative chaperone [Trypanosoma rangeli]RNE97785.1 putative chaperone [Trypanosoma rangeli]|eukprot:RNE97785.1 putative chaperone [Trypanosoma rangeli]
MSSSSAGVSASLPPLYAVLGVPVNVSQAELSRHFKRLSLQLHPDRASYRTDSDVSTEAQLQRYQRITEAYEILSDPERRAAYDTRHSVNFSLRVTALREALERCEASSVPVAKRSCLEQASGAGGEKILGAYSQSKKKSDDDLCNEGHDEEEEDEEYTPD